MRRSVLASRENAAHRAQILASIGRRLRDECDIAQPFPDRLAELVNRMTGPTAVPQKPALRRG